jgi:hypothetical protein
MPNPQLRLDLPTLEVYRVLIGYHLLYGFPSAVLPESGFQGVNFKRSTGIPRIPRPGGAELFSEPVQAPVALEVKRIDGLSGNRYLLFSKGLGKGEKRVKLCHLSMREARFINYNIYAYRALNYRYMCSLVSVK